MAVLNPTPFQNKVLSVPESISLFLGGGRGGGKSWSMGLLILRHIELYREKARVLYVRRSFPGIRDFELVLRQLFSAAYGNAAQYNASDHVWRLPYGYVELGCLDGPGAYDRFQGRSFTLVVVDELTQFPDSAPVDMLRSNLRAPQDVPVRMILAGNPGGLGHSWVARRYVHASQAWSGFDVDSVRFIRATSTFVDNPYLDHADYERQLNAACASDPELMKAWTTGDWSVARGAFFAGCLDPDRCAVEPWEKVPKGWHTYLAHDFGSSAPSATYVMARSTGAVGGDGIFYPRDSLVALDELATYRPGRFTEGLGWTVPRLGESIREMCARWKVPAMGCADDACFARVRGHSAATIADEFADKFWRDLNDEEKGFLEYFDSLLNTHPELKFFNKTVHLYTLFAVMNILRIAGFDLDSGVPKLLSFIEAYKANVQDPLIMAYREGASSRTRSKASREKRVDSLMEWVNPRQQVLA